MAYLILAAFNRKADLDNGTPKILPPKSPHLAQAVVFCSLIDYLQLKPKLKGARVIPDIEIKEFHWFCWSLANGATTRPGRQIRKTIRHHGFNLQHYQTILDGAEMWYKTRVLCNTAREAADYYRIDPVDLSKRIEPYDDATGWPRHR